MIKLKDILNESGNKITSAQAIKAGKDLIPIIKKWTAKDKDYLSFAYDKWQELLVKKYKIDPVIAVDIRNHLYAIHNRHHLNRLHNVAYGVINNLTESVNEDKFETSLSDPKKYKMGTMWFKRWWKPKKEMAGWTYHDDGKYIWLTRPKSKQPTIRFEKRTGLLQGDWVDYKEMQW